MEQNLSEAILEELRLIRQSLQVIAGAAASAPDIHKPIGEYDGFDWSSIGAEVVRRDEDGASVVEWNGKIFKRRSPDNKYEPCVWFSRCVGKDEGGNNKYEWLITFEQVRDDVEPLGSKVRRLLSETSRKPEEKKAEKPAQPGDVVSIQNRPLSNDQLQNLAQRFVTDEAVSRDGHAYLVKVNPKITYRITQKNGQPTCECERFTNSPTVRCEHLRAVGLWVKQPVKPDNRNELKLLITDALDAGFTAEQIDGFIARVCDGVYAVEDLDGAQIAKALRSLNQKLEERRLKERASA